MGNYDTNAKLGLEDLSEELKGKRDALEAGGAAVQPATGSIDAEEQYKAFLNKAFPGGLFSVYGDETLTLYFINDFLINELGYEDCRSLEKYRGSSAQNLIPESYLEPFEAAVRRIIGRSDEGKGTGAIDVGEGGTGSSVSAPFACKLRRKDGLWSTCTLTGKRTADHKGHSVVSFGVTINDAVQGDNQASHVLDNLPAGVLFGSFKVGVPYIEGANDKLCRLLGYSVSELTAVDRGCMKGLIYDEDEADYLEKMSLLSEYPHTMTLTCRLISKDGTPVRVTQHIKSMRAAHRQVMMFYSVVSVTGADGEVLLRAGRPSALSPCAVAIYENRSGVLRAQYVNETFCKSTKLTKEECIGLDSEAVLRLAHEGDRDKMKHAIECITKGGETEHHCEFRINDEEGQRRARMEMIALRDGDVLKRVGIMMFDIADAAESLIGEDPALCRTDRGNRISLLRCDDGRPFFRTFGFFDVFVKGAPIPFRSAKAKELLALLVDRRGGFVSSNDIIASLWEDEPVNNTTLARCRKVFMRLAEQLAEYGIGDILESHRSGGRRIVPEKITCDLFNYLSDNEVYADTFKGSYMRNYSWSEYTLAELDEKHYLDTEEE